ncbi:MAG: hypothetical protein H0X52_03170, partial [Gemmatimonadetes bacterium]|nr:hypothetical protein [Gemmatimonadota bacterium]
MRDQRVADRPEDPAHQPGESPVQLVALRDVPQLVRGEQRVPLDRPAERVLRRGAV